MDERNEKLTSLSIEIQKYLKTQQHNPSSKFVGFLASQCKGTENLSDQDVVEAAQLALNEFSKSGVASNVSGILPDQPIDFSHFTPEQFEQLQEQVLARVRDIVAKFAAEDTEHKLFAADFCAEDAVTLVINGGWSYNKIFLYDSKDDRELMRCYLKQADYLWIAMRKPVIDMGSYDPEYDWYRFKSLASIDDLDLRIYGLIEYYKLMDIKKQFEG